MPEKEIAIGTISSNLIDTSNVSFDIEKPFFREHYFSLKTSSLYPEDSSYFFKKIGTNPVFFQLLYVPSEVIYHPDIEPKPEGYSARRIEFLLSKITHQDLPIQFNLPKPTGYLFRISEPEVNDYLANLKPKIQNIELLNQDDLIPGYNETAISEITVKSFGKLKIKKLKVGKIEKIPQLFNVKVPGMGKYKSTVSAFQINPLNKAAISQSPKLNFSHSSVSLEKYEFSIPPSVKYYDIFDHDLSLDNVLLPNELKEPNKVKDKIQSLLKKTYRVKWDERKEFAIDLTESEEERARFLAENNYAFLAAELGINKVNESLAALKFLLVNRIIHSVLIILPTTAFEIEKTEKPLNTDFGWIGKLVKYYPELSYTLIKGSDDERTDAWNKSANIYLTDSKTLKNDFRLRIVDERRLEKIDCIVIDEVQNWLDKPEGGTQVLKKIHPKVLWTLTSLVKDGLLTKVNEALSEVCRIDSSRITKLVEVSEKYPEINYQEFWLKPNEHQLVEYKETLKECRKELQRVLESGNPFRFQANIFTLLHKLYQVQNFAHGYDTSPKTELLLDHIQTIKKNGQKVIIISQYDGQGTRKIERLLDHNRISYIKAPSGLSADELKKAVFLFKNKETITVFLTNAKESRLHFEDMVVPYIIKFDSWWNPAMIWHTKNLFMSGDKKLSNPRLNIFAYKTLNAVDEEIHKLLSERNLFEQNITSAMPSNTINDLISIDEWLEIFQMPVENTSNQKPGLYQKTIDRLSQLSLADYRATLVRFFFALGYSNTEILEHENSASFDITGEGKAGNRTVQLLGRVILDGEIKLSTVKQIIFDAFLSQNKNIFIITRGKFEGGTDLPLQGNVTLLDNQKLTQYLVNLNLIQSTETQTV